MILGLSTATYTLIHVLISLVGIGSGFLVLINLLGGTLPRVVNILFLVTTILTSLGGFAFPNSTITPGIVLGILSLVVLAVALFALYGKHLVGVWGRVYAIAAMIALYFNTFVLFAQVFQKVPAIHALAPTGTEPPFKIAMGLLLVFFVVMITLAAKRFRSVVA